MEPRIAQTTQNLSDPLPLERTIDAIELTDEDLEKVTGTWGGFGGFHRFGFHRFGFHHFHHFHRFGGFGFHHFYR
jgi:hypothetical protein